MIRGLGELLSFTYSQTLNGLESGCLCFESYIRQQLAEISSLLSGPFLVSRTGDAG